MGRSRNKNKGKGGYLVENLPKVAAPAAPSNAVAASNPEQPGSIVFCKRGNELPSSITDEFGDLHQEFKDTIVPNALVKKGIVSDNPASSCLNWKEYFAFLLITSLIRVFLISRR